MNKNRPLHPTRMIEENGASLREYAAIQIASGLVVECKGLRGVSPEAVAGAAVTVADALLKELAK